MTIPFGPQLIGATEKTLNALLTRALLDTGLTEPQWVTLRLAGKLESDDDGDGTASGLVEQVRTRAHFDHAQGIVADLTARGLLADGRLTADARQLVDGIQRRIATMTATIWADLSTEDVAATTRILNEVTARGHAVLRDHSEGRVA